MPDFLTEESKNAYIQTFYEGFETLLKKKRLDKKARRTKYKITDVPSVWPNGIKKRILLTNGKTELTFSVTVRPWRWEEGTLFVEFEFEDARRLALPKKRVKPKNRGAIWSPNRFDDPFFFLRSTEAVSAYVDAVELTTLDVGLFDSIEKAAEAIFGK